MKTAVVWFKRDMRIHDHAPLRAAEGYDQVVPLYMVEPAYWQQPDSSRRHWHALHDALTSLDQALRAKGSHLVLKTGTAAAILETLLAQLGPFVLFAHEETGNAWTFERDKNVTRWAKSHGIPFVEYPSHGVVRRLTNRDTWSKQRDSRMVGPILEAPQSLPPCPLPSEPWPSKKAPLFGAPLQSHMQTTTREEAEKTLQTFLKTRSKKYLHTISKPGLSARHCSRLSTHIAYGTLSVREIEQLTKQYSAQLDMTDDSDRAQKKQLNAFLSRLAWRCHFVQKLEQQPALETHCMHPLMEHLRPAQPHEGRLRAWQEGRTGYPLIDASMRSLHENGWITFRMRAMLMSFASYHLWLDWRHTAPYLATLFTDYEPGIHYAQVQMQSGTTGINAVRMYNPTKQAQDHDPEGAFIRRYIPELNSVPQQFLHEPWKWPAGMGGYPAPLVEHETAIRQAREALSQHHRQTGFREEATKVFNKLGSRNRAPTRASRPKKPKNIPSEQLTLDM